MAENERIIFQAEFDTQVAREAAAKFLANINELREKKKELDNQFKNDKGNVEYTKQVVQLNRDIAVQSRNLKNVTRDLELSDRQLQASSNSYEALTAELNLAEKQLKQLANTLTLNEDGTISLSEEYNKQFEIVRKLKDAQLEFDSVIKNGKSNVGNYKDSVKEAFQELNLFGVSGSQVTNVFQQFQEKGLKGSIKELINLGKAFLTSPIGIVVIAVAALTAAFQRNQRAMETLSKVTELFGSAIDFALVPLNQLIDLTVDLVEISISAGAALTDFFGITENASTENAFILAGKLIEIEKQLEANNVVQAQSLAIQEKLKTFRDDESQNIAERLAANRKLQQEIERAANQEIKLENEKLKILETKLKRETNSVKQVELQKQVQEQQSRIAERLEFIEGRRVEALTNQNSLIREQKQLQQDIAAVQLELEVAQGRIVKGSQQELNSRIKLIKENSQLQLEQFQENAEQRTLIERQTELEIQNLRNEFNQKALENAKNFQDKQTENKQKQLEKELAILQTAELLARKENRKNIETSQQVFEAQEAIIKKEAAIKIFNAKKNAEQIKLIETQLKEDLFLLETEFTDRIINKALEKELEQNKLLQEQRQSNNRVLVTQVENRLLEEQNLGLKNFETERELARVTSEAQINELREQLLNKQITQAEFFVLEQQALLQQESAIKEINQRQADSERVALLSRLDLYKDFVSTLGAIGGEQTQLARIAFLAQKKIALAEVGINLQQELSNQNVAASKLDAAVPFSGVAYRIGAILRATTSAAKIISEIKKSGFAEGGYTGNGGKYDVAGFVHRGEVVWSQRDVALAGGVQAVEALRPTSNVVPTSTTGQYFTGGIVDSRNALAIESQFSTFEAIQEFANNLPNPVVSVEDIATVQRRVQTIENNRRL